jgi:PAS domain S-box-containing protein
MTDRLPNENSAAIVEPLGVELQRCQQDIDDLKRIERQLRHSEAFLAEAQRISLTGSFGWNLASDELVWSAATYCILGYEPTEKPSWDLLLRRVHPEDRKLVQEHMTRAQCKHDELDFEHRLMLPDGTVRHVRLMARRALNADNEIEYVGALMDITQRAEAARALRASEHLARGQLEALTNILTALAREPKSDKFLEHVLRMICRQLSAHSIGVWVINDVTGNLELSVNYEDNKLHLPTPEQMQVNPQLEIPQKEHPVWSAFFRGKIDCVHGRIDAAPPRVRIAPSSGGPWYDNSGRAAASPIVSRMCERLSATGVVSTLCIPMLVAGQVTGFFSIRFTKVHYFRPEESELTHAMAHQATLAIRLMRLSQQTREAAVTEERNRMARDIHDTLAQGFTGVIVQLEAAKGAVVRGDLTDTTMRIQNASELAKSSLREARRSVLALRPPALKRGTLHAALSDLLRRMTDGTSLHAELEVSGDQKPLPSEWEENLLRITQEALTNAIKYAQAFTFRAILQYGADELDLRLSDDGRGYDMDAPHEGFGLMGMKERVDRMAGRLLISSSAGQGTAIRVIADRSAASRVSDDD